MQTKKEAVSKEAAFFYLLGEPGKIFYEAADFEAGRFMEGEGMYWIKMPAFTGLNGEFFQIVC